MTVDLTTPEKFEQRNDPGQRIISFVVAEIGRELSAMLVRVAFAHDVDPFLLFERKRLLPGKRGRPTALPGRDR